jgi:hypothetical protein
MPPLTAMHMAMIRDCLMGSDLERLKNACSRPCWTVASDEFYAGHCFTSSGDSCPTPTWKLQTSHSSSQMELAGLVQFITHRHLGSVPHPAVILHPWQAEPPLQGRVNIDVSHHHPQFSPKPPSPNWLGNNSTQWADLVGRTKQPGYQDRCSTIQYAPCDPW